MCELGWILYCQCVHKVLHGWNKRDKIVTIRPTWVLQNNKNDLVHLHYLDEGSAYGH